MDGSDERATINLASATNKPGPSMSTHSKDHEEKLDLASENLDSLATVVSTKLEAPPPASTATLRSRTGAAPPPNSDPNAMDVRWQSGNHLRECVHHVRDPDTDGFTDWDKLALDTRFPGQKKRCNLWIDKYGETHDLPKIKVRDHVLNWSKKAVDTMLDAAKKHPAAKRTVAVRNRLARKKATARQLQAHQQRLKLAQLGLPLHQAEMESLWRSGALMRPGQVMHQCVPQMPIGRSLGVPMPGSPQSLRGVDTIGAMASQIRQPSADAGPGMQWSWPQGVLPHSLGRSLHQPAQHYGLYPPATAYAHHPSLVPSGPEPPQVSDSGNDVYSSTAAQGIPVHSMATTSQPASTISSQQMHPQYMQQAQFAPPQAWTEATVDQEYDPQQQRAHMIYQQQGPHRFDQQQPIHHAGTM